MTTKHMIHNFVAPMAAGLLLLSAGASFAKTNGALTFNDLEYDYAPASRVAVATADLTARIPAGTPVAQAVTTLRQAGAHCRYDAAGAATCVYSAFEVKDEFVHDVKWTVQLRTDGGRTTDLQINRAASGI